MPKTILLIGTLDTKGAEFAYVRDLIAGRGQRALVMDAGVLGAPGFTADVSAAEVAEAGGAALAALRQQGDRGAALDAMIRGAVKLAVELHAAASRPKPTNTHRE